MDKSTEMHTKAGACTDTSRYGRRRIRRGWPLYSLCFSRGSGGVEAGGRATREKRWTLPPQKARQWAAARPVLYRPVGRRPHGQVHRKGGACQRQGRAPPQQSRYRRVVSAPSPASGAWRGPPRKAATAAVSRRVEGRWQPRGARPCVPRRFPPPRHAGSGCRGSGSRVKLGGRLPPARARCALGRHSPDRQAPPG